MRLAARDQIEESDRRAGAQDFASSDHPRHVSERHPANARLPQCPSVYQPRRVSVLRRRCVACQPYLAWVGTEREAPQWSASSRFPQPLAGQPYRQGPHRRPRYRRGAPVPTRLSPSDVAKASTLCHDHQRQPPRQRSIDVQRGARNDSVGRLDVDNDDANPWIVVHRPFPVDLGTEILGTAISGHSLTVRPVGQRRERNRDGLKRVA